MNNVIDVKLEDVPELGYTKDSKPHPCGEICVKTPYLVSGYYKDEKTT
jgi:fatty acid CoA ligase FadD9